MTPPKQSRSEKVILDVLVTDFKQWLACAYMAEAARSLPEEIQELIDLREWDMRTTEGIRRLQELGAKSLPSIALDEELVFESIIPGQEELTKEILKRCGNRAAE